MVALEKGDPPRASTARSTTKYFDINIDEAGADKYGRGRWLFHL